MAPLIKFRTGSTRGDFIAASFQACKLAAISWPFYRHDIVPKLHEVAAISRRRDATWARQKLH